MKSAAGQYRLRIALAAINPTVGDLAGNSAEVARAAAAAAAEAQRLALQNQQEALHKPLGSNCIWLILCF